MASGKKNKKDPRPQITAQMLKDLQAELRDLDLGWIELLEAQIRQDVDVSQDYKNELSVRKIYNVFSNIVRNNGWKVLVYGQGKTLRTKLQKKLEKVATE